MKVFEWLIEVSEFCGGFHSTEGDKVSKASNSEIKRWCKNKAVVINERSCDPFEEMPKEINSVVLFPKGKRKYTLFYKIK